MTIICRFYIFVPSPACSQKVCHEIRVHIALFLLDLLEGGGHDAEVAAELLGHVQDLVLVVEHVHRLGVGIVAHSEGSLNIVGDISDKVEGVLDGLGVEILLLVGGHHNLC